jgi:hypothetical protein
MKRFKIRKEVISWLERFFYKKMPLHEDFPVVKQIYAKQWAEDMYEQLTDAQRRTLYFIEIQEKWTQ